MTATADKITITVAEYNELKLCQKFVENVAHTGLSEEMMNTFHEISIWAIPHENYAQRIGGKLSEYLQAIFDTLYFVRKEENRYLGKE